MNGIAGVVILYHPDEREITRNINSYLPFVGLLIVIDNSEAFSPAIRNNIESLPGNVQYIHSDRNYGIAAPLNVAARMARNQHYTWLLTMDQDSYFDTEQAELYFELFSQHFLQDDRTGIVAVLHDPSKILHEGDLFHPLDSVITSGSLVNLNAWNEAGGYDEKLVIDEVDHEFCYHVRQLGYPVVQINRAYMNHQLGTTTSRGYFGTIAKSNRTIHSPRRVYFMVRNYLYVRKKYKRDLPSEFKKRDRMLITALKNNLFFSGKFIPQLKSILNGYMDFKRGDFHKTL
jgi:rhamnosyltransferase